MFFQLKGRLVFSRLLGHKVSYLKSLLLYLGSFSFLRPKGSFLYQGKSLPYFHHRYNLTWLNERKVEIPIVNFEMQSIKGNILEVGNVLSHYCEINHLIIDKYEKQGAKVINLDVVDHTSEGYDGIISVSTVEHIGQDEGEDPAKAIIAIQHMRELLKKGGRLFITFPLGYNTALDKWIMSGQHIFGQVVFIQRHNIFNEWSEISLNQANGSKFNHPYPLGNVVACCKLEKK